jgi:P pilus assembly chaperone PapD
VLVQNPGTSPVHVNFTLNTESGEKKPGTLQDVTIPAGSRVSFNLGNFVNTYDVSTKVEATDGNVICERAMYFTLPGASQRVLGHDSIGVTSPAPVWYLAEGATAGGFETWVLVQNPGASPVHVNFTLNTESGEQKPPGLQNFTIPAGSRVSFDIGKEVTTYDVSTRVEATDGNVICERAMYFTPAGMSQRVLGHDSIGVTSPASVWYLAEGATAGGFETWVLVQNPGTSPVHVNFTLNTESGEQKPPGLQNFSIPAGSRVSFDIGKEVTTYDVSTKVEATDGNVICERAMYFTPPGAGQKELGHDSIGFVP